MQTIPWQKIKVLEEEIKQLKVVNKPAKKTTSKSLYGILRGVRVSEKDIKMTIKIPIQFTRTKF